jgi:heme-degrading monooxygenase HmoA
MITRIWHGRTKTEHADEYLKFVEEKAVPDYKSIPGNLSVEIWRRIEDDLCHFWTVTKWENLESIRSFAGDELEKAKYYPEDEHYLLEFEPTVIHCETFIY